MSRLIPLSEASQRLSSVVHGLRPGEEVILTENDQPVARLLPPEVGGQARKAGACAGLLEIVDDGDDGEIEAMFEGYVPR